ncbi:MAG: protease inhibitor I9 family protein, partial [Actinomycetota bacterium]|nr:protease inhibitor I9 family protein [Actinomycetota bacterium]
MAAVEAERSYAGFLAQRHDDVLSQVGGTKFYDYTHSFNGFAARMTRAEAAALRRTAGVVSVERDRSHRLVTERSPKFLGLN